MKTTRRCPKCDSSDVLRIEGERQGYGIGDNVRTGVIGFGQVVVTKYLCGNCGYIEEWVDDQYDISEIKKNYSK